MKKPVLQVTSIDAVEGTDYSSAQTAARTGRLSVYANEFGTWPAESTARHSAKPTIQSAKKNAGDEAGIDQYGKHCTTNRWSSIDDRTRIDEAFSGGITSVARSERFERKERS